MSAADQRAVVAVLRQAPPEGVGRWTPGAVARAAGLDKVTCDAAIRVLRNGGKIKWGALELSASMMESQAKADDEPAAEEAVAVESVSRAGGGARPAAGRAEAAAGDQAAATERLDDLGSVQDGLDKCPRTGSAGTRLVGATVGGSVKPPLVPSATDSCVPPGQAEVAAAGGVPPPPAPGHTHHDTLRAGDARLGEQLLAEIEAYLARTRMSGTLFGELALTHPGFVNLLRKRRTARDRTAVPVRAFMARWPDGATRDQVREAEHARAAQIAAEQRAASEAAAPGLLPGEGVTVSLADAVKAEALAAGERRQAARKISATVHDPLSPNVVGIQAALLAQPEDLFAFLRRKWPRLLAETIALARAEEKTPAAMLVRVIEAGLLALGGEREEAA